jgi:hypothetical protein
MEFLIFLVVPLYFGIAFGLKIWPFRKADKKPSTGLGMWIEGIILTPNELEQLDGYYQWAKSHGLTRQPDEIYIKVIEGNYFAFAASPTGSATGAVLSARPAVIQIARGVLHVLKHELVHVILWDECGDYDYQHQKEIWKQLSV